jgi:flagellar hook-basal body complex protein FliE
MNQINGIGPIEPGRQAGLSPKIQAPKDGPSFKDTLQNFMSDVNDLQNKAGESVEKLMAGEINDVHQVMNAAEEAKVAFNMMMEIRNKVMDAYEELMRIRV